MKTIAHFFPKTILKQTKTMDWEWGLKKQQQKNNGQNNKLQILKIKTTDTRNKDSSQNKMSKLIHP